MNGYKEVSWQRTRTMSVVIKDNVNHKHDPLVNSYLILHLF